MIINHPEKKGIFDEIKVFSNHIKQNSLIPTKREKDKPWIESTSKKDIE